MQTYRGFSKTMHPPSTCHCYTVMSWSHLLLPPPDLSLHPSPFSSHLSCCYGVFSFVCFGWLFFFLFVSFQRDNLWACRMANGACEAPCSSLTKGAWPGGTAVLCLPLPTAVPREGARWAHVRWKTAWTACVSLFGSGLRGFVQTTSRCHAGNGRGWVGSWTSAIRTTFIRGLRQLFHSWEAGCPATRLAASRHHHGEDVRSGASFNIAGEGAAENQEWVSPAHLTNEISFH